MTDLKRLRMVIVKAMGLILILTGVVACEDVTNTLGITEAKKSDDKKPTRSCKDFFWEPEERIFVDKGGRKIDCLETYESSQYINFYNRCTSQEAITRGYSHTDSNGQLAYCSNSGCNFDDRLRGFYVWRDGNEETRCGFYTPSYYQNGSMGYGAGY